MKLLDGLAPLPSGAVGAHVDGSFMPREHPRRIRRPGRKALFIAYHFPPDAAVGAIRPAKTAKYLSRLGWDLHVVTVKEKHCLSTDHRRLQDVTGTPITRTAVWPTLNQLAIRLRDSIRDLQGKRATGRHVVSSATWPPGPGDRQRTNAAAVPHEPISARAKRYLAALSELPDDKVGWLVPAVWASYRLIKREHIKVVVTSSPPATTALVGLVLSLMTDIRLVTDLRDPWFRPFSRPTDSRTAMSELIQEWLERQLMRRSSKVITTTEQYRDFLRTFHANVPSDRFCSVWNGYDEEDFAGSPNPKHSGIFTVAYLGTFYFGRTPKEFLSALAELVKEGIIQRSEIRVNLIGDVRYAEGLSVEELVRSLELDECVTIRGAVGHREALLEMRRSDLLLLLAPDQYYSIPAKAFEYVGAAKKILCLARAGATADFVRESGHGLVVEPDNVEAIKNALRELLTQYKGGIDEAGAADNSKYTRRVLSERLSQLLEECIAD